MSALSGRKAELLAMLDGLAGTARTLPKDRLPEVAAAMDRVRAHLAGVEEAEAAEALEHADPALVMIAALHVAMEAMTTEERADAEHVVELIRARLNDAGIIEECISRPLRVKPAADTWLILDSQCQPLVEIPAALLPPSYRRLR